MPRDTPQAPFQKRNAMSRFAKPAHKRVARMVGYVLTLGGFDAFMDLAFVLRVRLTREERSHLAWAALRSLDDETAAALCDLYLGGPQG